MKKSPEHPGRTSIKTTSLKERTSKVSISDFCKPYTKGSTLKTFLDTLPTTLAAKNLKEIVQRTVPLTTRKGLLSLGWVHTSLKSD